MISSTDGDGWSALASVPNEASSRTHDSLNIENPPLEYTQQTSRRVQENRRSADRQVAMR